MKQNKTEKAGFSLIELLFAMLFLSIIVFGVIKLQTSNLTLSHTKQLELRAHFMAAQGLEIVEALGKTYLDACASPCYISDNGSSYTIEDTGPEELDDLFEREITFSDTYDDNITPLTDAYLVTATVSWTDSSGFHTQSAKRVIHD